MSVQCFAVHDAIEALNYMLSLIFLMNESVSEKCYCDITSLVFPDR